MHVGWSTPVICLLTLLPRLICSQLVQSSSVDVSMSSICLAKLPLFCSSTVKHEEACLDGDDNCEICCVSL